MCCVPSGFCLINVHFINFHCRAKIHFIKLLIISYQGKYEVNIFFYMQYYSSMSMITVYGSRTVKRSEAVLHSVHVVW